MMQMPNFCVFIFHLIWAGIGLYIYNDQMNSSCKQESIGKMILAWCIIQYCGIGLALCCLCFGFCVAGGLSMIFAKNAPR